MSLLASALLLAACAATPPPAPAPEGEVGYQVVPPQSEGQHRIARGQAVRGGAVHEGSVVLPHYPAHWLARRLDALTLDALVVVDEDGLPGRIDTDASALAERCGDCAQAFVDSIEAALRQWTFAPLEITDWIDGPDEDGDGEPDSVHRGTLERRPYSLRLRFTFSVRDGEGVVTGGPVAEAGT